MQKIRVFNTLTGKKEPFRPLTGNKISLYACGPTVYDSSHLGHARMAIVWDVVHRYLRFAGYDVTFVRNITDVDDKIINKANALGVRPEQVARHYLFEFWRDMQALNVAPPDVEPRATEFLNQMIEFIQGLIAKGHAYAVDGDVYFDEASFKTYGRLARKQLDELRSGHREQVRSQDELAKRKRNPADFALWKGVKAGEPNQMGWQSPWGMGRPGWHIECSTMIKAVLGETIDIHAGGEDLVFPHHENEIAQSESLHDKPLARYWLHNSFVTVNKEKMAKSAGNFKTIAQMLASYCGDTIRLMMLQTHYRKSIDFSVEALDSAGQALMRLVRAAAFSVPVANLQFAHYRFNEAEAAIFADDEVLSAFHDSFVAAMNNDFNAAEAVAHLFALSDKIMASQDVVRRALWSDALREYAGLLGLTLADTRQVLDAQKASRVMDAVVAIRQDARGRKDFALSDLIRDKLAAAGVNVNDTKGGATWEKK